MPPKTHEDIIVDIQTDITKGSDMFFIEKEMCLETHDDKGTCIMNSYQHSLISFVPYKSVETEIVPFALQVPALVNL